MHDSFMVWFLASTVQENRFDPFSSFSSWLIERVNPATRMHPEKIGGRGGAIREANADAEGTL